MSFVRITRLERATPDDPISIEVTTQTEDGEQGQFTFDVSVPEFQAILRRVGIAAIDAWNLPPPDARPLDRPRMASSGWKRPTVEPDRVDPLTEYAEP